MRFLIFNIVFILLIIILIPKDYILNYERNQLSYKEYNFTSSNDIFMDELLSSDGYISDYRYHINIFDPFSGYKNIKKSDSNFYEIVIDYDIFKIKDGDEDILIFNAISPLVKIILFMLCLYILGYKYRKEYLKFKKIKEIKND